MQIRLSTLGLALATLTAGALLGCDEQKSTAGDPRVDGLVPHAMPEADPTILNDQNARNRVSSPTPAAPTASAPSTATAPAGTETAPATEPETAPATTTATTPAAGPEVTSPASTPAAPAAPAAPQ